MKNGQNLVEIAKELERQAKSKKDFIAPSKQLEMKVTENENGNAMQMRVNGKGHFGITGIAHSQIAQRLSIPQKYYDRMRSTQPELLARNVNTWLQEEPETRMVRTLDGDVRALLSKRYRPLDNNDMAEVVLPELVKKGCRIESAALTESRLYIKAVTEKVAFQVKPGDIVHAGLVVSNSEVGMGSVKVEPMIFRLVCSNGLISADSSLNKYHVGRAGGDLGNLAEEFLRDDTRQADDKAFWMKVQDVVRGALDSDIFGKIAQQMTAATKDKIEAPVEVVIERVQQRWQLTDGERSSVLKHLIRDDDMTRYGLLNAFTRASQDVSDYERATDFERLGGQVLELPRASWVELAATR